MAGEIEEAVVSLAQLAAERIHSLVDCAFIRIPQQRHLKADLLQRPRHVFGIVHSIVQGCLRVGSVADHQGRAFRSLGLGQPMSATAWCRLRRHQWSCS